MQRWLVKPAIAKPTHLIFDGFTLTKLTTPKPQKASSCWNGWNGVTPMGSPRLTVGRENPQTITGEAPMPTLPSVWHVATQSAKKFMPRRRGNECHQRWAGATALADAPDQPNTARRRSGACRSVDRAKPAQCTIQHLKQLREFYRQLDQDQLIILDAQGSEISLRLADVLRIWQPNNMNALKKLPNM